MASVLFGEPLSPAAPSFDVTVTGGLAPFRYLFVSDVAGGCEAIEDNRFTLSVEQLSSAARYL